MGKNDTQAPLQRNMTRKWARRIGAIPFEAAQWVLGWVMVGVGAVLAWLGGLGSTWRWLAGARAYPPTPAPAPKEKKGGGTSYLHLSLPPQVLAEITRRTARLPPGEYVILPGDTLGDEWLPPQERGVPIPTAEESAPRKISQENFDRGDDSCPGHALALRDIAGWFRDRHQPTRAIQCEQAAAALEKLS